VVDGTVDRPCEIAVAGDDCQRALARRGNDRFRGQSLVGHLSKEADPVQARLREDDGVERLVHLAAQRTTLDLGQAVEPLLDRAVVLVVDLAVGVRVVAPVLLGGEAALVFSLEVGSE
jgi:hypothetical protein